MSFLSFAAHLHQKKKQIFLFLSLAILVIFQPRHFILDVVMFYAQIKTLDFANTKVQIEMNFYKFVWLKVLTLLKFWSELQE